MAEVPVQYSGPPIFGRSVIALIGLSCAFTYLGWKELTVTRADLVSATGKIKFIEKYYSTNPSPHSREGKMRYLALEGQDEVFSIFVGKEGGDFAPALNHLDSLHVGDEVVLYFEDGEQQATGTINTVRFVDAVGKDVFVKGGSKATLAWVALGLCLMTLAWLVWLKSKGRVH